MKDKIVDYVYETYDYSKFKILKGNRGVASSRVAMIIDSIIKIGFRNKPILVNEKFEIIDGQGRFASLKELGKPILYVVDKDADINVCCALNINQKNWGRLDYIKSFAARGYKDYQRVLKFIEEYSKYFNFTTILGICEGVSSSCNSNVGGRSDAIESGRFKFFGTDIERAREFEYLKQFVAALKSIGGTIDFYYSAILFAYRHTSADKSRLVNKVNELYASMPKVQDMKLALENITDVYNRSLKSNRVYIDHEYRVKVTDSSRFTSNKENAQ